MIPYNFPSKGFRLGIIVCILSLAAVFSSRSLAATDPLAELHDKAKKEGGKLALYAPLSARAMNVIPGAFMKRFPGVTVDHIDATPDKPAAAYMLSIDDIKEFPKYEKLWKEIFQIR